MASQATLDVKSLRDNTGISMAKCKTAYDEAGGDLDEALRQLRIAGETKAAKLAEREAAVTFVQSYVHHDKASGSMIKIGCETDFAAASAELASLAQGLCMHIVSSKPTAINEAGVNQEEVIRIAEDMQATEAFAAKPPEIQQKMLEGAVNKYKSTTSLMAQTYVIDESVTVEEFVAQTSAKLSEKIEIQDFALFS